MTFPVGLSLPHGVRRSRRCQLLTSQAGFSFIFFCLCVASRKFSYCYMCSRHYLNQINYKIVNIVKTCGILSSSAIKVYQNNCYVSDWLEVSIETKLFGQLFQIPSFPLHSSDISYKPYLSMDSNRTASFFTVRIFNSDFLINIHMQELLLENSFKS